MGFFSKLFGGDTEKIAKEMLGEYAKSAKERIPNQNYSDDIVYDKEQTSGLSYGKKMPAEENQFSFGGTYVQYFEKVFKEEFPEYQIEHEDEPGLRASVFTFYNGGEKALVVEILSETSRRNTIRKECYSRNIPYLRFYHNHDGWWNTRSYVASRTKDALSK